ncbi:MAG: cellulase family glycosylhydrolase [Ruminococcus sp.]|nr:cellulase family glycosylhydrolase [Ruminococcus sp.]
MQTMTKRALTLSMVCTMALSSLSVIEPARAEAAFDKNAQQTVADMGLGWNLGNTLDAYNGTTIGSNIGSTSSETAWGNPATTKAMIDMVKDSGVKTVRVPVTWYEHMDPNTYKIDDRWMNRVEEIVNWVLEDDMYCIINVHHDTGEKGWLKANSTDLSKKQAMFSSIWEQVSDNFKDYGDKLLFEGFNEILDGSSNQWWIPSSEACPIANDLNQKFVDIVRRSGGNNAKRNLICNTYCGGANREITSQYVLPKDTVSNRLIVEAHVYQPFEFTHEDYPQTTTWSSPRLDDVLNNLNNTFVRQGLPVIIGEFGCADKGNMSEITSWAKYLVESATAKGMACIWWDNGSQYKIYNRRSMRISQPELLSTMLKAAGTGSQADPPAPKQVEGDIDCNGELNEADAELLRDYLAGKTVSISSVADINKDDVINVLDLKEICVAIKKGGTSANDPNNLCANEDYWTSWTDTSNGAQGEMYYVDNGIAMQVNKGGKNDWDAQFFYEGLTLEQGATYKLSFDYVSDRPQTTALIVNQGHGDYLPYFSDTLYWTTGVRHYSATFDYTSATDNMSRLTFNLGGGGVSVPYKATVTNVVLVKVSGGTSSTTPEPETETSSNLTGDVSKFSGWASEEGGASASFTSLSDGFKITVNRSGSQEWHVQGIYPGIKFEQGAAYEISFDYQADKSVGLSYKIQQNYEPYDQYFYAPLSFTTQKQHYSTRFTMTDATDDDCASVFNCGAANGPYTVTITNMQIKKVS